MRYRLLGQLEVVTDDGRVVAFAGDKERIVLAALSLGANRVVSVFHLIDALWGEDPPERAANALQVQVSRLRKKLAAGGDGGAVLFTEPSGYRLAVGPGELDVARSRNWSLLRREGRRRCRPFWPRRWRCGGARRYGAWPRMHSQAKRSA
jgi:DNA-binding SARP family transcriptional activator